MPSGRRPLPAAGGTSRRSWHRGRGRGRRSGLGSQTHCSLAIQGRGRPCLASVSLKRRSQDRGTWPGRGTTSDTSGQRPGFLPLHRAHRGSRPNPAKRMTGAGAAGPSGPPPPAASERPPWCPGGSLPQSPQPPHASALGNQIPQDAKPADACNSVANAWLN